MNQYPQQQYPQQQYPQQYQPLSFDPDTFETGGIPLDQNLLITGARFCVWDYNGKAPATVAAEIKLRTDAGEEHIQYYSIGSPDRLNPSPDGNSIISLGSAKGLPKGSNYADLCIAMLNAGFPKDKMASGNISYFVNLYAFWIGQAQKKREGIEGAKQNAVIAVPSKIHSLSGPVGGGMPPVAGMPPQMTPQMPNIQPPQFTPPVAPVAPPPPMTPPPPAPQPSQPSQIPGVPQAPGVVQVDPAVINKAGELITSILNSSPNGSVTRHQLAAAAFQQLMTDPMREPVTNFIFSAEMPSKLGLKLEGETITRG